MAKSKIAKYKSRRRNPAKKAAIDLATNVGAGFAGYGAARLLSRIAYSQAVKRWPNASKHVHVAAAAAAAAGVYFGSKHWEKIDEYHEAATIGAGIALMQTAIQTYLPKFGWVVSDVNAEQYGKKKRATMPTANMAMFSQSEQPDELASSDFDLDALLLDNPEVEAVAIAQSEPARGAASSSDDMDMDMGGYGDLSDLENFNGLMN